MDDFEKYLIEESFLSEFIKLYKEETNLSMDIWVDYVGKSRKRIAHNPPSIFFSGSEQQYFDGPSLFQVSISEHPKIIDNFENESIIEYSEDELEQLFKWIKLNKKVLMNFWRNKIKENIMRERIQKIC